VAPNVVSPHASAEVMFRTVGPPDAIHAVLRQLLPLVEIEEILRVPHVLLKSWTDGPVPTAVFPFTTDIPLLDRWGTPLLFGPGSFLLAHTAEEFLELREMDAAVETYTHLARACLGEAVPMGHIS
jgi:acetylornithine deacetylase